MAGQIEYVKQLIGVVYSGKIEASESGVYITVKVDDRDKVKADLHKQFDKQKFKYEDVKTSKSSFAATKIKTPDNKDVYIIYKSLKSGGSGAGAETTELGECAQCWYTAVAFNYGKLEVYEDFLENTERVKSKCHTTVSIDKILKNLTDDWVESSVEIANYMLTMPQFRKNMKSFKFHRGSPVVDKINDMFLQCNRTEKLFANINKWTPADIWLITPTGEQAIMKSNAKTFAELNTLILYLYNSQDAIGVSLKKIGSTPHHEIFNYSKSDKQAEFKSFKITEKAKDGYMLFAYKQDSAMSIQFRSFAPLSGWQGEIKGKYAAGGKIGGGQVAAIMQRVGGVKLTSLDAKSAAVMANSADKKMIDSIIKYSKDIGLSLPKMHVLAQTADWLYSKFLTVELFSAFNKLSKDKQSAVLTEIIGYSSSATENSTVFIKIS